MCPELPLLPTPSPVRRRRGRCHSSSAAGWRSCSRRGIHRCRLPDCWDAIETRFATRWTVGRPFRDIGHGWVKTASRPTSSAPNCATSRPGLRCWPRWWHAWSSGIVPSRSRAGCGRIFPTIRRCGCHTRRSIRPSMSSHAGNWPGWSRPPCVPVELGENHWAARRLAAASLAEAMSAKVPQIPEILRRSPTWDQGSEMALHTKITEATGLPIYFCDPHSPWQRGTNENTNGLLRQYFPKGTDLSFYGPGWLDQVAAELNARPRKRLGWRTPAEELDRLLSNPSTFVAATA